MLPELVEEGRKILLFSVHPVLERVATALDEAVDGGTVELRSMVKGSVYESSGQLHGGPTAQIMGKRIRRSAAA